MSQRKGSLLGRARFAAGGAHGAAAPSDKHGYRERAARTVASVAPAVGGGERKRYRADPKVKRDFDRWGGAILPYVCLATGATRPLGDYFDDLRRLLVILWRR